MYTLIVFGLLQKFYIPDSPEFEDSVESLLFKEFNLDRLPNRGVERSTFILIKVHLFQEIHISLNYNLPILVHLDERPSALASKIVQLDVLLRLHVRTLNRYHGH